MVLYRDNGALYGRNLHNAAKKLTVPFVADLWPPFVVPKDDSAYFCLLSSCYWSGSEQYQTHRIEVKRR